ncbi:MAG: PRD domain-containing protein [Clostridiales bacterium]|nr:PRD domain-containing protein [Clostridiales bacterium]
MIIEHVINNNIVSSLDGDNEVVVSGRGIGFGRRPGDPVDDSRIEKIYRMDTKEQMGKFKDILASVPPECLKICDEIIADATKELNVELNRNIYVTLTDHVNFALERYDQGMDFENILTEEVSNYYPNEFRIGLKAVELIKRETGKNLRRDEAASIALHIVSAELNTKMSVAYGLTQMVKQIQTILERDIDMSNEETRRGFEEMVPSFKHFAYRVIADQQYQSEDDQLYEFIRDHYPRQYECCTQIEKYVNDMFGKTVSNEEKNYMVMKFRRLDFINKCS